jgi:hypothetical protein
VSTNGFFSKILKFEKSGEKLKNGNFALPFFGNFEKSPEKLKN